MVNPVKRLRRAYHYNMLTGLLVEVTLLLFLPATAWARIISTYFGHKPPGRRLRDAHVVYIGSYVLLP